VRHYRRNRLNLLKRWIAQGAAWAPKRDVTQVRRVDFVRDIQPILKNELCLGCHREGNKKGGLRLDNKSDASLPENMARTSFRQRGQEPGSHQHCPAPDHDDLMPPAKKGGPVAQDQIELLRDWVRIRSPLPAASRSGPEKAKRLPTQSSRRQWKESTNGFSRTLDVTDEKQMKTLFREIPGSEVISTCSNSQRRIHHGAARQTSPVETSEGPEQKLGSRPSGWANVR